MKARGIKALSKRHQRALGSFRSDLEVESLVTTLPCYFLCILYLLTIELVGQLTQLKKNLRRVYRKIYKVGFRSKIIFD